MIESDLGIWKVKVEVTYDDPKGREQYFSNFFYIHITEPELVDDETAADSDTEEL